MTTQDDETPPPTETITRRFAAIAADAASKTGPIHMINMVRFREQANYGADTEPGSGPMSGAAAYALYVQLAGPFVQTVGGSTAWASQTGTVVIGPEDEAWDAVFAVRYPNRAAFVEMVTNPEYQAIAHHRTAAVADSRLILTEIDSVD